MNKPSQPASAPASQSSHLHHAFTHAGQRYALFKRRLDRSAAWYIHFQHRGRRHLKSLEVNSAAAAVTRAKRFIDGVRSSDWNGLAQVRSRASAKTTIAEIEKAYFGQALVASRTARNNALALRMVVRVGIGIRDPGGADVALLTDELVRRYQSNVIEAAGTERDARERAGRSSLSTVQQARSLFSARVLSFYRGLTLPDLRPFMTCKLVGNRSKPDYHPPSDGIIAATFDKVGELEQTDPPCFLAFWFAVGAGLRRGEIAALRWEHLIERDGRTWVSGGIGKDGGKIEVPVQSKALAALLAHRKQDGKVMPGRGVEWAKRLNWWLRCQGWDSEKKLHELRAYVGSLIYRENPLAAMKFMRHSSIRITERHYVRYRTDTQPIDVL